MEKDFRMYVLVNEDIKIGKGKLAGQVGHAVMSFLYRGIISELKIAIKNLDFSKIDLLNSSLAKLEEVNSSLEKLDEYMKIQKKILLKCSESKLEELEKEGYITIRDKGLTQLEPNTLTCVNLGIMDKKDVPDWVNELRLYN